MGQQAWACVCPQDPRSDGLQGPYQKRWSRIELHPSPRAADELDLNPRRIDGGAIDTINI